MRSIFLTILWSVCHGLRVAIVGAHGGLGRELVQQTIDRKWKAIAYVRRADPIFQPCRKGWLEEDNTVRIPIRSPRLLVENYGSNVPYDAIVFALSGRPFEKDESDRVVFDMCGTLPKKCKTVCLVSAYGVGDSLRNADVGIQAMSAWYLKDAYRSKRAQESIVCALPTNIKTIIMRPRVLSFAPIPYNPISTTRQDLARSILGSLS